MIVNLIRFVEVSHKGQGTLLVKTDVPGPAIATACTITLASQADRQMNRYQVPIETRAVNLQIRFTPAAGQTLIPYSCAVIAKALGQGATAWRRLELPLPTTPEQWTEISIPIPETPEGWTEIQLPVPETPEGWAEISLPIPDTPEGWTEIPIVSDEGTGWRWENLPGGQEVS